MANCPNCNTRLDKGDRFCSFCGSANAEYRTTSEDLQKVWQAAQTAYQRGDHANGVTLFKQVTSLAPSTLQAYYYLADCHTNLGQIDQAIETLRAAQVLQPGSSTLCFNLGVLEKRLGRQFEARQHVQDALRLLETDSMVTNRDELRAQMQKTLAEL
jgi:tetratricopeptide (TPR) repeat protein